MLLCTDICMKLFVTPSITYDKCKDLIILKDIYRAFLTSCSSVGQRTTSKYISGIYVDANVWVCRASGQLKIENISAVSTVA